MFNFPNRPQPHLPNPPPPPTLPTSSNKNSSSQNRANRNRVNSVNNSSTNNHFNHTAVNNVNSSPHPAKGLLKILQFNCNGISGKAPEIAAFLSQNQIHIAVFQETKLRKKSRNPSLGSHYTLIRKDREKEGGGLLIAIHESIQYEEININNDGTLEAMGISVVASSSKLRIYNFYIPPRSSCPPGYSASLAELLEPGDALVLGDANAHSQLWNSNIEEDQRGSVLSKEITESTFAPLNDDTQTRVPFNSENQLSSPDISLSSQSFLLSTSWTPIKSLGSDHLPILLELPLDDFINFSPKRTFINFLKADWIKFTEEIEEGFFSAVPPSGVAAGEKFLRDLVLRAARHHIPAGRIRHFTPSLSPESTALAAERDFSRQQNLPPEVISQLNCRLMKQTAKDKENKWREFLRTCDYRTGARKFWKVVRSLNGSKSVAGRHPITFGSKPIHSPRDITSSFNKQFTNARPHASDKLVRITRRKIAKLPLSDSPIFTPENTKQAIADSKPSRALGPDGLCNIHLKHLGPLATQYLTYLFNISLSENIIPQIWKNSKIAPLPKPNKDLKQSTSYRPISLLCPAVKILERLVHPIFTKHLPNAKHQHGFRPFHSTTTALSTLEFYISDGFNQNRPPKRTVLATLDLSKAFDVVCHRSLVELVHDTPLPRSLVRWLSNYLNGRQAATSFREHTSPHRIIDCGVPQGSVLSPTLFNFYVHDAPPPPDNVNLVSYADDFHPFASSSNIDIASNSINSYLKRLYDFFTSRKLSFASSKGSVTLFSSYNKEFNKTPSVLLNNEALPLNKNPTILGVTFDPTLCFATHCKQSAEKARRRIGILKALAGSTWGHSKETLLLTFKALIRPILDYAAPAWSHASSNTSINCLQVAQNQSLRVVNFAGSNLMSSTAHLHSESEILTVKDHHTLLSSQFFISTYRSHHPINFIHSHSPPPRLLRPSIISCFKEDTQKILTDFSVYANHPLVLDDRDEVATFIFNYYKPILKDNHTSLVTKFLAETPPSKVICIPPPKIDPSEKSLPRPTRCKLSQLRSGYSRLLNTYLSRLDSSISHLCPTCSLAPHTTCHLFNCSQNPSPLTPADLWLRPVEVAKFLDLETEEPNPTRVG